MAKAKRDKELAELKAAEDAEKAKEAEEAERARLEAVNIEIETGEGKKGDVSQESVDAKSTVAPTAIHSETDAGKISIVATRDVGPSADGVKKDGDDADGQAAVDASSVGKGALTIDTREGDDSIFDAALSNPDYVHPTIRRTEVVLKEKADQRQK